MQIIRYTAFLTIVFIGVIGCNKYLDWKNQVVYYVRKHKQVYKVETIIKGLNK